jgi:hypothetical protein
MDDAALQDWLAANPLVLAYLGGLLLASLASFWIVGRRAAREFHIGRSPIDPWRIERLDFIIFICALVLWFAASGALVLRLARFLPEGGDERLLAVNLAAGFLLQVGLAGIFLAFRQAHRRIDEGPLSPRLLDHASALKLGLLTFLAALPVIYAVNLIWLTALQGLMALGIDIELPPQDAVLLFLEADNPFTTAAMIVLAVIVAPVVEELVFRAGIYRYLKGRSARGVAMLLSSLLFGLVHANLQSFPGLVAVGICLCIAYEVSGNLRVPMVFHACFNLNSVLWILILPEWMW